MKMRIVTLNIIGIIFLTSCLQKLDEEKSYESTIVTKPIRQTIVQKNTESIDGVTILNSGPRGGNYLSSTGRNYRYAIFRIQFINDMNNPVCLDLKFPSNPISLLPDSTIGLDVFIIPEKHTPNTIKDTLNFGVNLESYFESGAPQEFELKSKIHPKQQFTFFIGMLFEAETANGVTRSQLAVEGHDESPHFEVESKIHYNLNKLPLNLIYGISFDAPNNYISIPCGQVQVN